jgi:hypothetical protein
VDGEPHAMGYCHCESCRSWSASPVNGFSLWSPGDVKVTKGAENIGMFAKTPASERQFCKSSGGHIMTNHPGFGMVDVYAATIPGLDFKPAVHVFYAEKVMSIKDGLPKMKDLPAEFGGSGEALPE